MSEHGSRGQAIATPPRYAEVPVLRQGEGQKRKKKQLKGHVHGVIPATGGPQRTVRVYCAVYGEMEAVVCACAAVAARRAFERNEASARQVHVKKIMH